MPSNRPLIVAINNDAAFLHLLEALLREARYETLLLQTGDIALDTVKHNRPKLIILDIESSSPDMSWKLVDLLTHDPETTDIPLVVCSVADETLVARREKLVAAGHQIIEKPFNLNELTATIQKLLGQRPS
jgi:CheY-like chemotaxis protein